MTNSTDHIASAIGPCADFKIRYLFVFLLALAALQSFRHPVLLDDAYITFRAARNFARGEGLVFNPGEKVLATTAPGLAVILGGLTRAGIDTVVAARLAACLALALACGSLLMLGRKWGRPGLGFAAGFVLCFFPDLIRAWGNECALLIGLFALAWLMLETGRPIPSAAAAAVGCMIRPDFALAALVLAVFWLRRSRRGFALYALTGAVLSAAWLVWLTSAAGSPWPHTLAVKRLQGLWIRQGDPRAFAGWFSFARGLRWFVRRDVFDAPVGALALVGGLLMLRRARFAPLLVWSAIHVVAYDLLGVPGQYFWYLYPLWLLIPCAVAVAIVEIGDRLARRNSSGADASWFSAAFLLGLAFFAAFQYLGLAKDPIAAEKYEAYRQMADIVRREVPPGESVMMNEIGQIGYESDCRVIDTHGLIHPDLPESAVNNLPALVERFRPDYIALEGWLAFEDAAFRREVEAGTYAMTIALSDGSVTYRPVSHVSGFEHFMPVLLNKPDDWPAAITNRRTEGNPER